jgi:hypothetical protein
MLDGEERLTPPGLGCRERRERLGLAMAFGAVTLDYYYCAIARRT